MVLIGIVFCLMSRLHKFLPVYILIEAKGEKHDDGIKEDDGSKVPLMLFKLHFDQSCLM